MASDVFYCILFAFAAIVVGIHGISQSKYEKTNNVLYMKQNVAIESHSRKRRDVGGTEHNFTDFHFKHEFLNETKLTLAITWAGENNGKLIVVVTDEELTSVRQSTIYQSVDDGKTFMDIGSRVGQAVLRKDNGLQVHPFNREKVYLVAWKDSNTHDLWTSSNGGDSFTKYSMPFRMDGSLVFHPHVSYMDRILAHNTSTLQLWLSVNGGANWKSIASNVVTFKWDDQTTSNDTIFALIDQERDTSFFGGSPDRYKLMKSIDLGEKWADIHARLVTFGVAGQFLFVTAIKPGHVDEERVLKVSQDGGESWAEVQLPTLTSDRFYSILDMAEGVVMIHVDNPGDSGHGTLYISDATGIVFSESLPRHLYPNVVLGDDITDFYRVQSLRGVYLASQMEADNSIHTMISFNRGGHWSPVTRPTAAPCVNESKACYLQIHNQYSMSRNVRVPQGPYSTDTAVGIILVHGVVADGLQTTPPDVYVSSDGGYTWIKALDGPHLYQIVDQGGLLVAVSAAGDTADTIKYSTDVGQTWDSFKFTDETFVVTGLLTEPGNRAMSVAVWGYTSPNRTWQVHTLNFTALLSRQCEQSDYEPWVAHWDSSDDIKYKGCLLGRKQTYERLKKNSKCYNGRSKDVTQTAEEKCLCTKDDYDCDYGYYRDDDDSCVLDPQFKGSALEICDRGHVEEIITEGYHKDPGDMCEGGFSPTGKRITLAEECAEGDKSLVKKEMHMATPDDKASSHTATSLALVFVSIVVGVMGVVLILFFVGRYRRLQLRQSLHYRLLHSDRSHDAADQSLLGDNSDEESQRTPLRGGGGHASSGALRTDDDPLWSQSPARGKQRNLAESDVEMLE